MKCPNCGKDNSESAKFCQSCGTPLSSSTAGPNVKDTNTPPPPPDMTSDYTRFDPIPEPQKPKNRGLLIALIVSGIVIVGLAVILGFMLAGSEKEEEKDTTIDLLSSYGSDVPAGSAQTSAGNERELKLTPFSESNHLASQGSNTYYERNMIDGNPATTWSQQLSPSYDFKYYAGPQFNIEPFRKITGIVINNGYGKSREAFKNNTRAAWVQIVRFNDICDGEYAEGYSEDGVPNEDIIYEGPLDDTMEPQRLAVNPGFNQSKPTNHILIGFKADGGGFYRGAKWPDLCISELKIYGE